MPEALKPEAIGASSWSATTLGTPRAGHDIPGYDGDRVLEVEGSGTSAV